MKNICVNALIGCMKDSKYAVFEDDSKNYNLNIVGIRSNEMIVNKFNDVIVVFWKNDGKWSVLQMGATTLAGIPWMENPMNKKGCAILASGQYRGAYSIGTHVDYLALVQSKPVTVYRDDDRDREYDMLASAKETGMFGINIHRAAKFGEVQNVDKWSAGCQVIQSPSEFSLFMEVLNMSRENWGNSFTYTLINESNYKDYL